MKSKYALWLGVLFIASLANPLQAQQSVARQWNEALLAAIRVDYARPTVHARNLFHTSIAMYDAWAAFDGTATPYLLGNTVGGFSVPFNGITAPANAKAAQNEAISYAAYRLLSHRFQHSPAALATLAGFDALLADLGYDANFVSTDYSTGSPAALGNYIADWIIKYGFQDGANEQNSYQNRYYKPLNPPISPDLPGPGDIVDLNHWQPMVLDAFIDQSGHLIEGDTTTFLSPEWGNVTPFALKSDELSIYQRNENAYWVYHDPGTPPQCDTTASNGFLDNYKWNFLLVSIWQSHHDPDDGVMWDISPASSGNNPPLPQSVNEYRDFYNLFDGGDPGKGWDRNPVTGLPYEPQIVPRADYARVLAEFWADGPASETPPGHWFTILNYVNDHPLLEKRFRGEGDLMDDLEWDVKAYFILGGAVHDAAVAAWGIKGWYDYVRPISAIRAMAARGQSSNPDLPNYNTTGIPLIDGYVELVGENDPLAGRDGVNINKIKLYTWRGPAFVFNPATDIAGVGWILAERWWPYQRPTFVTPPFAGYVSGHSTFSRAAAEVLTMLTGDPFFPGGMGEFFAPKNEFLVFEDGPSVDVTLQWATYRDASDQTSLSRIWGGIHPPADDIPGRLIGEQIGIEAFEYAEQFFQGKITSVAETQRVHNIPTTAVFPNPARLGKPLQLRINAQEPEAEVRLYNILGQLVLNRTVHPAGSGSSIALSTASLPSGTYLLRINGRSWSTAHTVFLVK